MVSPRYMAGAGDRFADVLGPLIHLFGWRHDHDPATGTVAIDSPDGSVFVDFRLRGGGLRISVPGRQRVSITTFDILHKHGLVSWDNGTALYIGQGITVTKEGRRALAGRRSERSSTVAPAPASAPTASPGVGR